MAIESRDEFLSSVSKLKIKLLEEEARQMERDGRFDKEKKSNVSSKVLYTKSTKPRSTRATKTKNTAKQQPKFSGKCYECGKIGHKGADCYVRKKREVKKTDDAMMTIACNVEVKKLNIWYLDSAATKHMSNEKQKFYVFDESVESKVFTASDQWIKSYGVGKIELNVKLNDKKTNRVKLTNAIFVPELKNNVILISQITKNGFKVIFNKNRAIIKLSDGSSAMVAEKRNQFYIVDIIEDCILQTSTNPGNFERWHKRFGHLNFTDLKKLQMNNMVKGLNLNSKSVSADCVICARRKIQQLPYKNSKHRQKEKLGLIHSDMCSPKNEHGISRRRKIFRNIYR